MNFSFSFILIVALVIGIMIVGTQPVSQPIQSLEDTHKLLSDLGLKWTDPGVPVILFASSTCPYSNFLEKELISRKIGFIRVDVNGSKEASKAHGWIGRSILGNVATRATPTTVVGTSVIRGSFIQKVIDEIKKQNASR